MDTIQHPSQEIYSKGLAGFCIVREGEVTHILTEKRKVPLTIKIITDCARPEKIQ